jgi:TonB family protein
METFAFYLLKSVVWLSGFTLIFVLFLRNERYFSLNRIYLISGIVTSFLFPFISLHYTVSLPVIRNLQTESSVVTGMQIAGNSSSPDIRLIILVFYLSGVLFILAGIIKQSKSALTIIKKSEILTSQPVKLIRTAEYSSSFSFFSYVFVNPSITDLETKEIINHELVHIRQRHWLDLVLVEFLCLLQWFNPLVWVYIRFIRQNHEYLADEVALQRTSDPAIYKATLLNQIAGTHVVSLANSFSYSLNKKRFNMMKNIISSPYRKLKLFLILPVFAIILYAFAEPEYRFASPGNNTDNTDPVTPGLVKDVKGVVVQQINSKPLEGAVIIIKGTSQGTTTDTKGNFKLENVSEEGELVVSFIGFKTKVIKPEFGNKMAISMISDTVKYLKANISTPPPPPPPSVLPPPPPPPPPPPSTEKGMSVMNINPQSSVAGGFKIRTENGKSPLFVVDGKIMTETEATGIDPENIQSINVRKDKYATDKYGEKGTDGVIEITTKQMASRDLEDGLKNREQTDSQIRNQTNTSDQKERVASAEKKETKGKMVIVEELPEFSGGGEAAMIKWISDNLKYPGEAVKGNITGKVFVDFMVSSTGKVKNVQVSKPVHPVLDAEAIRVISNMPDWKPGSQAGKPVDVQIMVPVQFKLKQELHFKSN